MKNNRESLSAIEKRIDCSPNPYAGVGELAAEIVRLINDGSEKEELLQPNSG
jgi:hypothetical protein